MPFELTDPDNPYTIGSFDTVDDCRHAAVRYVRETILPKHPNLDLTEQLLLIATFIYDPENWVRDPFGTTQYCHCGIRFGHIETELGDELPSFFIKPT